MAVRKQKQPIRSVYVDIEKDLGNGFIVNTYIARINKVRCIDTDKIITISQGVKNLYCALSSYGYSCGYSSIYENQDKLAYNLGVTDKTIRNQIKVLKSIGLLYTQVHKDKAQFDSNSYWLTRPNMIPRVQWLDIKGDVLKGKLYNFNSRQFQKPIEDCKNDKLLQSLLLYVKEHNTSTSTIFNMLIPTLQIEHTAVNT